MDVETQPPQPDPVVEAIAEALAEPPRQPDPWWEAGIREDIST